MRNFLDEKLQVILPQNYLAELKDAPNDGLSFSLFFENVCTAQKSNCLSYRKIFTAVTRARSRATHTAAVQLSRI